MSASPARGVRGRCAHRRGSSGRARPAEASWSWAWWASWSGWSWWAWSWSWCSSTPTVIVTVAPLRALAPAAGLCFRTTPTCAGSVVGGGHGLGREAGVLERGRGRRLALRRRRSGTATSLGACATVRLTLSPACTEAAGGGRLREHGAGRLRGRDSLRDRADGQFGVGERRFGRGQGLAGHVRDAHRRGAAGDEHRDQAAYLHLGFRGRFGADHQSRFDRRAGLRSSSSGLKPAARSLAAASRRRSARRRSTAARSRGRPRRRCSRVRPFLTTLPAAGAWLITRPLGTVVLGASEGTGSRPAPRSVGARRLFGLSGRRSARSPTCSTASARSASAASAGERARRRAPTAGRAAGGGGAPPAAARAPARTARSRAARAAASRRPRARRERLRRDGRGRRGRRRRSRPRTPAAPARSCSSAAISSSASA